MKRILPGIAALLCVVTLASCQTAPDLPPSSAPESQAPASSEPAISSSMPHAPTSSAAPSAASGVSSDTSSQEAPPPFSGREDGVTSIGVYNDDEQCLYWFTAEEATGFMKLFNELQYKSIHYPAGYYPVPPTRQFDIRVKKKMGIEFLFMGIFPGERS